GRAAAGGGACGYGACYGAGSINGGPYHFKLELLDGYSVGNRDNQLMVGSEECDPNIPVTFGTPTATDACDQNPNITEIIHDDVSSPASGSIMHCRTWQAADACGNTSTCSQCITVVCPTTTTQLTPLLINSGELHCTQTDNFYGSSNNGHILCTGENSNEVKTWLLSAPYGDMIIGCGGNKLTLTAADASCLNSRLPSNGSDAVISGNNTCNSIVGIPLLSNGRFRDNLLSQTIALMLNTRMDVSLGDVRMAGQYLTIQDASGCDVTAVPSGSQRVYNLPQIVLTYLGANNKISDLIDLGNAALCGSFVPGPGTPSLGDIRKTIEILNKAFEGCKYLIGFSNTLRSGDYSGVSTGSSSLSVNAYPNPFNSQTTIEFTAAEASDNLKVEIFNATGSLVEVLFSGATKENMTYQVEFDGEKYPSGVYIYRVSTDVDAYFNKLILIK
ncbi:MAG: T9SS type A sorting domain-containing protein, partial [Bacteroidia bacterium]|nr:T9SS type A sorting domain-containing protein [Bacteroidia bacterium]